MSEFIVFKDPTSQKVKVPYPPKRIVSLVPSLTETLFDLGLRDEVVGITRFCIHPRDWFLSKTRVGGTKDFELERIKDLKPDLIIANKEENTKDGLEELQNHFPVWTSDIGTFEDALNQIKELGAVCGKEENAHQLSKKIREEWLSIKGLGKQKKALYFIWKNPWMIAGQDTYISSVMEIVGLENVSRNSRYPEVKPDDFDKTQIDLLLFSSEPYPFKDHDLVDWKSKFHNSRTLLVDGEAFSWYGSGMLRAPNKIKQLLQ